MPTTRALIPTVFFLASTTFVRGSPSQGTTPASLKNLSLEELSQLEVTSPKKEPTPAFRSPVAIYVITGEDIRRSGATTIPEALRLAPGVEVARIDGSKWSVGIRGFGTRLSRSVLVLIDGRSVYTTLFAGTYWEVQDTLLEDIDRIEVIRGPGGTIWGPNAVDGVINIITRPAKETLGVFASAGGGNVEQGFLNFRYGGSGKGITYRAYAKAFTRGPEYHQDRDNFDDWRGAQGGFRMDWGRGDRDSFTVSGDLYQMETGERVGVSTYVPPRTANVDGNADLSGGNVVAKWNRKINDSDGFQVQAYYDRTNRHEPNLGELRDTFDIDLIARKKAPARQQFSYGAGARVSNGRFLEVVSGLVFDPRRRADYLLSGFLEDDISVVNRRLMITVGSKLLRTNYTGAEFEPSARIMWTPSDRQTYWIAYTHAVRTPSRAEEDFYLSSYLGTTPEGLAYYARFNANRQFAPEQLNGYELGYRTLIGNNVFVDFAGFFNHYHDLFSQDLVAGPFIETSLPFADANPPPTHQILTAQFRNDLLGLTTGAEIAPEWRPTNFWRLRGSYSFLHMDLKRAPGTHPASTPASVTGSSPQHGVVIDSAFDIAKKLNVDLIYRYVSALPAQNTASYSTGNAIITWHFNRHFSFTVTGENLLQPYHVEYAADPGLPVAIRRNVYASLAWSQ